MTTIQGGLQGNRYLGNEPEAMPAPPSEISDQLSDLGRALSSLDNVVDEMHRRLEPVSRGLPPEQVKGQTKPASAVMSPVAQSIGAVVVELDRMTMRIQIELNSLAI